MPIIPAQSTKRRRRVGKKAKATTRRKRRKVARRKNVRARRRRGHAKTTTTRVKTKLLQVRVPVALHRKLKRKAAGRESLRGLCQRILTAGVRGRA